MAADSFTFDGVVRLTRVGTSFVVFTIVVGFAAINTGNNSLYIGLTFMLGTLLLSGIASKGGLKHLTVEFAPLEEAWAGRPASGRLRVTNDSRIWNVRDVVMTRADLEKPIFVPILMRRTTVEVDVTFVFPRRGLISVDRLDLYTRYPFGFFLKKRRVRLQGEVVVFPRILDAERERERFTAVEGELSTTNRIGAGNEIHSFREYVRGDSLRHVYWKKSASLGRWIMKQTEMEAGRAVRVFIDPYKPPHAADDAFEQMISEAATFILDALQRGLEVEVGMPRVTLRAKEGERAHAVFRALALIEPSKEPVTQTIERVTMLFALGGSHDAKSA